MGERLSVAVQGFHPSSFLSEETGRIRDITQGKKVISAVSGGVDSTVATLVARQALGDNLLPIMIDTGLLRLGEPERVKERLAKSPTLVRVSLVRASGRFLASVKGETTAEEKRKKFRETFYQILKEEAEKEGCEFILQGTIAPDWIETQGGIKTQHNILEQVGIDPATTYGFKIIEPLADLYKDQVRTLGRHLNLPNELSERQPFPGPGLLVRCIGNVTKEKIRVLKEATKMVETSLAPFNYEQYFAAVIENRFAKDPSLKAISETASEALGLPKSEVHGKIFKDIGQQVLKEESVSRVYYDITPKPPGTIEFE